MDQTCAFGAPLQVGDFRAVEELAGSGGATIAEMPVHVAELFGGQ